MLLAFAIEFERESPLSLAVCANTLRVLDELGVRVRELPVLTGVSKEAISMALGYLQENRLAAVGSEQTGRAVVARLTPKRTQAQVSYRQLLAVIEERWRTRFGNASVSALREPLEGLVGAATAETSPFFRGWNHIQKLASVGPQARHSATLSNGTAPWRVP